MYKNKFIYAIAVTTFLSTPLFAEAEEVTFQSLIEKFTNSIISPLITLAFGVALVLFIWALVKYMTKAGDEKTQQEARQMILWGVIILTVMVSVWGLVTVVQNTFFDSGDVNTAPSTPQFSL